MVPRGTLAPGLREGPPHGTRAFCRDTGTASRAEAPREAESPGPYIKMKGIKGWVGGKRKALAVLRFLYSGTLQLGVGGGRSTE